MEIQLVPEVQKLQHNLHNLIHCKWYNIVIVIVLVVMYMCGLQKGQQKTKIETKDNDNNTMEYFRNQTTVWNPLTAI